MKRRSLLKQLVAASAATLILPSWIADPKRALIALENLKIAGEEEELLAQIADVIIPTTETPGAKAVDAHLFALIMINDCLGKEDKEIYLKGLRSFEKEMKTLTGKSFFKSSPEDKLKILTTLEGNLDKVPAETKNFYSSSKSYIVQGYLSSKHFLTNVKPYKLIPGPNFQACAPVVKQ